MNRMIKIEVFEEGRGVRIDASAHYEGKVSAMMAAYKGVFEYLYEMDEELFTKALGIFIDNITDEGGEDDD